MKIAVIGGGASGLMAAITAKRRGADVTVYEKLNRVGKKILATGNGRCNYTNVNMHLDRFHGNKKEAEKILNFFDLGNTLSFFEDLGIFPYTDEDGKVFPNSLQASSILDVLRYEIEKLKIDVVTDFQVTELRKNKDKFSIIGKEKIYIADKVIMCCGGKASPQLGTDGSGYNIAKALGHKIIEPFPALVQLKLQGSYFKRLSGTKFEGKVTGITDNRIIREEEGEILFTDYGISGPPILQISRMVLEEKNKGNKVFLQLDMFPAMTKLMIYEMLRSRFAAMEYKNMEDSLIGLINKKLIPVVLTEAGFDKKDKRCGSLTKKETFKIIDILKEWKFELIGHNNWQQAQVTAGGIDLNEVTEKLESKKIKGLYFAGEILDIDGDCGGYNLQWAWSSGYTAGYFSSETISR